MNPRIRVFAVTAIALMLVQFCTFAQTAPKCPPDKVWGGTKCEWRDYCKDGITPRQNGHCPEDPEGGPSEEPQPQPQPAPLPRPLARPQHRPQPVPVPQPVPQPACPTGYVLSGGRCVSALPTIICLDGKPSVNGKCPPKVRLCEQKTIFVHEHDAPKSPRKVLFVGATLSTLFERYVADTKAAQRSLDLEKLTVMYYDTTGERHDIEEKMTLGRYFNGRTIDQVWRRSFKSLSAAQRADAEIDARSADADLVCGNAPR